jgi:hypothetical protein
MKSILYIGATLMIGASIYGFVDYKKTSHRKEFRDMYNPKEKTEAIVITDKTNDAEVKKETPVIESHRVVKKRPVEKIKREITSVNTATQKESITEEKPAVSTKKKLSYKLFSRAPLDEKFINKDLKLDEPKTEPLKIKKTKQ